VDVPDVWYLHLSLRHNPFNGHLDRLERYLLLRRDNQVAHGWGFSDHSELVANALTHAFPGGRQREVAVTLLPPVNGQLTLIVCDNGVGLPGDFDLEHPQSLGLQLVTDLTSQLRGTIGVDTHAGTRFTIAFAELHYQERK
jgi:hypothetical protein